MAKTLYLAGPMTGLSFVDAENWRTTVQKQFEHAFDIKALNPARESHLSGYDTYNANNPDIKYGLNCDRALRARNLLDIKSSDLVFVNLLGAKWPSLGTIYEIGYATALGKPVVCVIEDNGNPHEHLMITPGIDYRFDDLERAVESTVTILGL